VLTYRVGCRPLNLRGSTCITLTAVQSISRVRPNSTTTSSLDACTCTVYSNKDGMSMRKLNLDQANKVACCESCVITTGSRKIVTEPIGAHQVCVKKIVVHTGRSECRDRYSASEKCQNKTGIFTGFHRLPSFRRKWDIASHAVCPSFQVLAGFRWLFKLGIHRKVK
jgi:hypothetical protein